MKLKLPISVVSDGSPRVQVRAKHLWIGNEKFHVRGATYGTFEPDADGTQFPSPSVVEHDFALMRRTGINAVRTYTVPPQWLLNAALRHGLRVMVGLPWEQEMNFLDEPERAADIERRVREGVRSCGRHPAILCYSIGNEIPAPIVRWYGARRVERFLERLFRAVKKEDPEGLVTYVNYPTTEYLKLPFLDLVGFNVYLESEDRLEAYLARLHNLAGDRPLLMAEIGLDSLRNGEDAQARVLDWQIRAAFRLGCAGIFVFAWTDEWYRGGQDIQDWDFGLVERDREPKPALASVSRAFQESDFASPGQWPRISVVVCCYNGAETLRDCLEGCAELSYSDFEVIVVDDGSTDASACIAREFDVRLIRTENRGLSNARNSGLDAATGEIIAYLDSDARPDPEWLHYLASSFQSSSHVGIGGPNIPPPGDGLIADCVAHSPGGPVHVLVTDTEAEHIPGCNMAFLTSALRAIGGFDPQFRAAGDDVDVCWRLQERGWTLGFSPSAIVWHHRRNSIRDYWKQQKGYGKAEAMLERKWPEKYNSAGHLTWSGRLYGTGLTHTLQFSRGRIYQGLWGTAPFQSIYQPSTGLISWLPAMPEWFLLMAVLVGISLFGVFWSPLLIAAAVAGAMAVASLVQAALGAGRASFPGASPAEQRRGYMITTGLHLLQPLARLWGRLDHGLTPWRQRGSQGRAWPFPQTLSTWSGRALATEDHLRVLESELKRVDTVVLRGGVFDRWDLQVRCGTLGSVRLRKWVEEHGAGRQLIRIRVWPKASRSATSATAAAGVIASVSVIAGSWIGGGLFFGVVGLLMLRVLWDCATATAAIRNAVDHLHEQEQVRGAQDGDPASLAPSRLFLRKLRPARAPDPALVGAEVSAADGV